MSWERGHTVQLSFRSMRDIQHEGSRGSRLSRRLPRQRPEGTLLQRHESLPPEERRAAQAGSFTVVMAPPRRHCRCLASRSPGPLISGALQHVQMAGGWGASSGRDSETDSNWH